MTPDEHLADIIGTQVTRTQRKYKKGHKEHGGNLWEKPGMLQMLEEELTDAFTYSHTLRFQLDTVLMFLETGNTLAAKELLKDILGEPVDN
jgi:hypothetical protein